MFKYLTPNKKNGNKKKNNGNGNGKGRRAQNNQEYKRIANLIRTQFKQSSKGLFKTAGTDLGGAFGEAVGMRKQFENFGGRLGASLASITGFGDYNVNYNTLLNPSVVPDFGPNSVRIKHKEYLGNVMGSENFVGRTYYINPGLSDTFPWLAGIARNYQQYRINGLVFQYVSTSAFALGTTNSALGKVIIATNYNAEDPPFTSTVGMLATQFATYCRPADSIMHALECARDETASNLLYIRTDLDDSSKDKRLTDLGFTEVSREGMQSTSEVGGLWISYDITLLKPILNPQTAISDGFDQFVMISQANNLYEVKITNRNNYLGGTIAEFDPPQAGMYYSFDTTTSSGYFLVLLEITLPDASSTITDTSGGNTFGTVTNCIVVTDTDKNGPFNAAYQGSDPQYCSNIVTEGKITGPSTAILTRIFQVTGPNPAFGITNITLTGNGVYWRFSVIPISYKNSPQVEGP